MAGMPRRRGKLRRNTGDRYARVKALAEQSPFPHERATAQKILDKMDAERRASGHAPPPPPRAAPPPRAPYTPDGWKAYRTREQTTWYADDAYREQQRQRAEAARARQAEEDREAARAYGVLASLQPGDVVEIIFAPRSSSSPNDKRTVTVTSVRQGREGVDAYTTSGKVRPGAVAGGVLRGGVGGEVLYQPTMQQGYRRVLSLRRL